MKLKFKLFRNIMACAFVFALWSCNNNDTNKLTDTKKMSNDSGTLTSEHLDSNQVDKKTDNSKLIIGKWKGSYKTIMNGDFIGKNNLDAEFTADSKLLEKILFSEGKLPITSVYEYKVDSNTLQLINSDKNTTTFKISFLSNSNLVYFIEDNSGKKQEYTLEKQ